MHFHFIMQDGFQTDILPFESHSNLPDGSVFYRCSNKPPQLKWLETIPIFDLSVLKVTRPAAWLGFLLHISPG